MNDQVVTKNNTTTNKVMDKAWKSSENSASADGGARSRVCACETLLSAPIDVSGNLITCHKNENPQDFVTITMLEACRDKFEAKERETIWAYNLFAFHPTGLNIREEVQFNL